MRGPVLLIQKKWGRFFLAALFMILPGCNSIVGEKPLFGRSDYVWREELRGTWVDRERDKPAEATLNVYVVAKTPGGRFAVLQDTLDEADRAGLKSGKKTLEPRQGIYVEGGLVPLSGTKAILQIDCYLEFDRRDSGVLSYETGYRSHIFFAELSEPDKASLSALPAEDMNEEDTASLAKASGLEVDWKEDGLGKTFTIKGAPPKDAVKHFMEALAAKRPPEDQENIATWLIEKISGGELVPVPGDLSDVCSKIPQ